MIDVSETQASQCERGRAAVNGKGTHARHPTWCSPAHCFVTDEVVRVHEQAPTRWENHAAEVRFESGSHEL